MLGAHNIIDMVKYVNNNLSGNYADLVSTYLKMVAQQINDYTLNKESRNKIANLMRISKYMIITNTLYTEMSKFKQSMTSRDISTTENIGSITLSFISFIHQPFINKTSFLKFIKDIIITVNNPKQTIYILYCRIITSNLQTLILRLPPEVFITADNKTSKNKADINDKLRQLVQDLTIAEGEANKLESFPWLT